MNFEEALADIMQQEESVVKKVLSGEVTTINRVDVEDILLEIKRMQRETEFLKELKKHRVAPIDRKVKEFEEGVDLLRNAVLDCMKEQGETKLDFPEVGKVTTRKTPLSFEFDDQKIIEDHLLKIGIINDVAESVWKFDKKKLNKVFADLKVNNNLPDGVKVIEPGTSISISFDEKADDRSREKERQQDAARWKKADTRVSELQFDKIDI